MRSQLPFVARAASAAGRLRSSGLSGTWLQPPWESEPIRLHTCFCPLYQRSQLLIVAQTEVRIAAAIDAGIKTYNLEKSKAQVC